MKRGELSRLALAAVLLLAAASVSPGCREARAGDRATAAVQPAVPAAPGRLLLTGEVASASSTDLFVPETPLWALQLRSLAEDGAPVKAGDPVAEFDATGLTAELDTWAGRLRTGGTYSGGRAWIEAANAMDAERRTGPFRRSCIIDSFLGCGVVRRSWESRPRGPGHSRTDRSGTVRGCGLPRLARPRARPPEDMGRSANAAGIGAALEGVG